MCEKVCQVTPETNIKEVAKLMQENKVGCIPVCNDNKVCGIVTDRDLVLRGMACGKNIDTTKVSDIMTCKVDCCSPETDIKDAEKVMAQNQIRRIPVMENNKIVGILTLGDLAKNKNVNTEGVCLTLENICNCDGKNAE